jgi:hypothetical protein
MRGVPVLIKAFWFVQVVAVVGTLAWGKLEIDREHALRELPQPNQQPRTVRPLRDDPSVVSDETLHQVLWRLRPQFRGPQPKINHVDHALRCWGLAAEFSDPECLSGVELRELLLDNRQFAEAWGPKTAPFIAPDTRGELVVRTQQGQATASHVDHTLAGLAEVGTPLDYPVLTPKGEYVVGDILNASLRDFSLNQVEYEWSTLAYLLYLAPRGDWYSTEGQRLNFDRLAERLMRQRRSLGVCGGQHRLHTLAMMLRVDSETPILSPESRAAVVAHLQDATRRLVETQSPEGFWSLEWPGEEEEGLRSAGTGPMGELADRILVTGHVLEWWGVAPEEVQLPREVVVRGAGWLASSILSLTDSQVARFYPFLTHGGRALALWRGREPAEVMNGYVPPTEAAASPSAQSPENGAL